MGRGNIINLKMRQNFLLLQNIHDNFDTMRCLWMFTTCLMIQHAWIVNDSCFGNLHMPSYYNLLSFENKYDQLYFYSHINIAKIKFFQLFTRICYIYRQKFTFQKCNFFKILVALCKNQEFKKNWNHYYCSHLNFDICVAVGLSELFTRRIWLINC